MGNLEDKIRAALKGDVVWVAKLDGVHVRDLPAVVATDPYAPIVTEEDMRHFKVLADIAAKSGDSKRIDRWGEVKEAAEKFTVEYYYKTGCQDSFAHGGMPSKESVGEYKKFKQLRPKIHKALGITKVNHPLARYAETVQLHQLKSWRSISVFDTFSNHVGALLQETGNRKLTMLYPGSGNHYAYLQTVMRLVENNDVDRVRVITTDIEDHAPKMLRDFKELEDVGLIRNVRLKDKFTFETTGGTEQSLTFQIKSPIGYIPVEIVMAVGRSGEAYFRDEYLAQADVAVIHDPDENNKTENALLADMVAARRRLHLDKKQLVIREGKLRSDIKQGVKDNNQGITPIAIPGQYGHCKDEHALGLGEFYDCEAVSANVLKF